MNLLNAHLPPLPMIYSFPQMQPIPSGGVIASAMGAKAAANASVGRLRGGTNQPPLRFG